MIPKLLSEKSEALQKVLKDAKEKLSKKSNSVGDFCTFYTFSKKLQENFSDLFEENINIQMLKDLARKHGYKINESDWETANTYTQLVEELLNRAQESEEDSKDKWRKQLEKDIPELDKQAQDILEIIDADYFDKYVGEGETEQILNEINDNKNDVKMIEKNLRD